MDQATHDRLKEIDSVLAASTPGPWYWEGNLKIRSISIISMKSGHPTVMDFKRWGMNGAAPRFKRDGSMQRPDEGGMVKTRMEHTNDFYHINHPDARLIEKAPEYVSFLRSIVRQQQEFIDSVNEWNEHQTIVTERQRDFKDQTSYARMLIKGALGVRHMLRKMLADFAKTDGDKS